MPAASRRPCLLRGVARRATAENLACLAAVRAAVDRALRSARASRSDGVPRRRWTVARRSSSPRNDVVPGHDAASVQELGADPVGAADPTGVDMDLGDLVAEPGVPDGPGRRRSLAPLVVGGLRDQQDPAGLLNTDAFPGQVSDQTELGFWGTASRRTCEARRKIRFSASRSRMRRRAATNFVACSMDNSAIVQSRSTPGDARRCERTGRSPGQERPERSGDRP